MFSEDVIPCGEETPPTGGCVSPYKENVVEGDSLLPYPEEGVLDIPGRV